MPPVDEAYVEAREAALVYGVRNVKGVRDAARAKKSHELNAFTYNLSQQHIFGTVSVTRFANSRKVGGASVGQPPPGLLNPKYVLGLGFVDKSTPVPTPAQLQSQFARPAWSHW